MKPPQQARSQKTLERVLDAAEEVISERGVAAMTVAELVRRAGSSVGAFYARFPDKDALLATLHERSTGEALATAELALDPRRWHSTDLSVAIGEIIRFTARLCRERLGLLLAFIALAASDTTYAERRARLELAIADLLETFLTARRDEVAHADLRTAAQLSMRMILATLEYGALVHRVPAVRDRLAEGRLVDELTRVVVGYLGVRSADAAG